METVRDWLKKLSGERRVLDPNHLMDRDVISVKLVSAPDTAELAIYVEGAEALIVFYPPPDQTGAIYLVIDPSHIIPRKQRTLRLVGVNLKSVTTDNTAGITGSGGIHADRSESPRPEAQDPGQRTPPRGITTETGSSSGGDSVPATGTSPDASGSAQSSKSTAP